MVDFSPTESREETIPYSRRTDTEDKGVTIVFSRRTDTEDKSRIISSSSPTPSMSYSPSLGREYEWGMNVSKRLTYGWSMKKTELAVPC